jgi:predicted RNA methylase
MEHNDAHRLCVMSSTQPPRKALRPIALVREFHAGRGDVDDAVLANALHIESDAGERLTSLPRLLRRFGNQHIEFSSMTFHELRRIFRAVTPGKNEIFGDAGAGYGHVVFYGACVAPCRFRAIEILPARCAAMRRSARRLGLRNVEIVRADAQTQDYDDLAYLFVNSPFFPDAARAFIAKLKSSRHRTPTVIAVNNIVAALRDDGDFTEIDRGVDIAAYRFGIFRLGR